MGIFILNLKEMSEQPTPTLEPSKEGKKQSSCHWFLDMKLWMKFSFIELVILITQYIVTPLTYSWGHWSQEYLEQVVYTDWQKAAIIDVQILSVADNEDGCPSGYKNVNAWFEGMEWGCICGGSSNFAQVNMRKCRNDMLKRS